jgi:hypothetical protein
MHATPMSQWGRSSGKRTHDHIVKQLRGASWMNNALLVSKESWTAFASKFIYRERSDSRLEKKWKSGQANPSTQSVKAVERMLPGTDWVYDLDMWDLLRNVDISKNDALRFIKEHSSNGFWKFPERNEFTPPKRQLRIPIYDTQGLTFRLDLWGFAGILALARFHEAYGDTTNHSIAIKDLFRAAPGALREPWLRPHAHKLLEALYALKARVRHERFPYDVDEHLILDQADDSDLELHPAWWRQERLTGDHIPPKDPILYAKIVRQGVKKKRG